MGFTWHAKFHGDEFVASFFESADDIGDKSSLDTIWFDSNEGSLGLGHFEIN